jgi:hypothetical protein
MEFRLPANLQSKLIAYDPELKALARTERNAQRPRNLSTHWATHLLSSLLTSLMTSAFR